MNVLHENVKHLESMFTLEMGWPEQSPKNVIRPALTHITHKKLKPKIPSIPTDIIMSVVSSQLIFG